ncbi:Cysteine dioxygenase type I [Ekhidna lutea]|uniref:Cysteine dioxygenase type I n=1 Tax=Ekhidna lutea TaxID=447679 RepID=A0A239LBR2_EKHLU|nr:cysteine dioxygenase family protein [Ekhidna lutea]SNT27745.1 Cysteine dioxygenase type I [Ekhidna lutea]
MTNSSFPADLRHPTDESQLAKWQLSQFLVELTPNLALIKKYSIMETIRTVEQLVNALNNCVESGNHVLDVMTNVEIPREEFEKYYSWSDEKQARNVLARNDDFEVLLVCWEKGQSSPIHDFNAQEAWIHPIEGMLREERFKINVDDDRLEKVSNMLLGNDEFSYMNQIGIHRYSNANKARSVSLNIYRKPVAEWHVYDEGSSSSTMMETWENKNYNLLRQEA